MAKVKLSLFLLSVTEKIQVARNIVTAMTGNAAFVTPDPALADITTGADNLENAYNDAQVARQDSKEKTTVMHDKEKDLDALLTGAGLYVENTSDGDEATIESAGMSVKAKGVPSGVPSIPQALSATAGDADGEIDLQWEPIKGVSSYEIQISPDPPGSWAHLQTVTNSKHSALGLTSGTKYWFRVAAINAAGQGGFSDPATRFAP